MTQTATVLPLTPDEERIILWLRSARGKSRQWMGTIRWVQDGPVQLFVAQPVRQIDRRDGNN